jgi:hypothetical protein
MTQLHGSEIEAVMMCAMLSHYNSIEFVLWKEARLMENHRLE